MVGNTSPLEKIFAQIHTEYDLSLNKLGNAQEAQGNVYNLHFETAEVTRLLYTDKVTAIDLYDANGEKSLGYSVNEPHFACQKKFLESLQIPLSMKILKKMIKPKANVDRQVYNLQLDDFSDAKELITSHINNF
tara:strand:- start:45498 stop:45899 length:402 start_codon:yes stop_codon:yes gene_type:complete